MNWNGLKWDHLREQSDRPGENEISPEETPLLDQKPQENKKNSQSELLQNLREQNDDLRSALEYASRQLDKLQKEERQTTKQADNQAMVEFLSRLNSGSGGMILDQFSMAEQTLKKLRQCGFAIPVELESVPACIRLFMNQIRSMGIRPICPLGTMLLLNLKESEAFQYLGSNFTGPEETKTVEVTAPGWKYGDSLISQCRVREVESR